MERRTTITYVWCVIEFFLCSQAIQSDNELKTIFDIRRLPLHYWHYLAENLSFFVSKPPANNIAADNHYQGCCTISSNAKLDWFTCFSTKRCELILDKAMFIARIFDGNDHKCGSLWFEGFYFLFSVYLFFFFLLSKLCYIYFIHLFLFLLLLTTIKITLNFHIVSAQTSAVVNDEPHCCLLVCLFDSYANFT